MLCNCRDQAVDQTTLRSAAVSEALDIETVSVSASSSGDVPLGVEDPAPAANRQRKWIPSNLHTAPTESVTSPVSLEAGTEETTLAQPAFQTQTQTQSLNNIKRGEGAEGRRVSRSRSARSPEPYSALSDISSDRKRRGKESVKE